MSVSFQTTNQSSAITAKTEEKAAISGCCDARLTTLPGDRSCHLPPHQRCSTCEAALCDLHAEFCAICLAFFCEGCLDLHNEDGQHADRTIGDLLACVEFHRAGEPGPVGQGVGQPDRAHTQEGEQ